MNHRLLCSFVATLSLAACAPVDGDAPDAPEVSAEAYTGRAGDLRPTDLTATCVGGTITARGAITHGGALGVGASVAQVRFAVPSAAFVDVAVPALSGGASAAVVASRGGYAPGTYTVSLTADAHGQVPEGSEANNVAWVSVYCDTAITKPDLRIENLRAVCGPNPGAVLHWDVVNRGGAAAGPSRTELHLSYNASTTRHLTGAIPAGGRVPQYHAYVIQNPTGVAVTADIDGAVHESNEGNNRASLAFTRCP